MFIISCSNEKRKRWVFMISIHSRMERGIRGKRKESYLQVKKEMGLILGRCNACWQSFKPLKVSV
jgi:hypothetical protein